MIDDDPKVTASEDAEKKRAEPIRLPALRNFLIGTVWVFALLYVLRHWGADWGVIFTVIVLAVGATMGIVVLETLGGGVFTGSTAVVGWCLLSSFLVHHSGTLQQQFALLMGFGAMFILFVVGMLNRYVGNGALGRRELATFYMMLLIAIPLAIVFRGSLESGIRNLHEDLASKPAYHWVKPWQAATSPEAVSGYWDGPGRNMSMPEAFLRAVPWREWVLPMLYWGGLFLSFECFWLFLVALMRRRWVVEERLPFPWTQPALQVIEEGGGTPVHIEEGNHRARAIVGVDMEKESEHERIKQKALRWGLALGLAITIPGLLPVVWEGLSSPIGVPPSPGTFGIDLTPLGLFEGVELHLVFDPFIIIAALFLPVDFLLTVFLTYVGLRMIVPWFLAKFGMPGYSGWIERRMYMALRTGGLVGIPLWTLWYGRDHIARALKGALSEFGRSGRGVEPEEVKDEVSSWGDLVAGVLFSGAGFLLLLVVGMPWGVLADPHTWGLLLLAVIMIFFLNFAYFRMRSEGTFLTFAPYHSLKSMGHWQKHLVGSWATEQAWHAGVYTASLGVIARLVGPHTYFGEPFRIGQEVGIHPRKVFRNVLLAIVLVLIFTGPLFLTLAYQYGVRGTTIEDPTGWAQYTNWVYYAFHWATQEMPNTFRNHRYWFWILLGVGFYGALFYLRRELVGWKINPIAVLVGAIHYGPSQLVVTQIWNCVFVALILKVVLFRWYGVRSFHRRIQPVLAWALVGMAGGMILLMFLHSLRGEGVWQSPLDMLFGWYEAFFAGSGGG